MDVSCGTGAWMTRNMDGHEKSQSQAVVEMFCMCSSPFLQCKLSTSVTIFNICTTSLEMTDSEIRVPNRPQPAASS